MEELCCVGGWALNRLSRRLCGVSLSGHLRKLPRHNPDCCVLGDSEVVLDDLQVCLSSVAFCDHFIFTLHMVHSPGGQKWTSRAQQTLLTKDETVQLLPGVRKSRMHLFWRIQSLDKCYSLQHRFLIQKSGKWQEHRIRPSYLPHVRAMESIWFGFPCALESVCLFSVCDYISRYLL